MEPIIIYEITATVATELVERYEKYMRQRHIPDLLATGYFCGARFSRSNENRYRILYEAHNQESLDRYLESEAGRLRADFLSHFPAGIELSRENWLVLEEWQTR